jgi:hypothetical protein
MKELVTFTFTKEARLCRRGRDTLEVLYHVHWHKAIMNSRVATLHSQSTRADLPE